VNHVVVQTSVEFERQVR